MAFIYLRRSRKTRSYLLIESYRDAQGRSRKRTLCYLGREEDGTDTLEKTLDFWRDKRKALKHEIRSAKGARKQVLRRRLEAAEGRFEVISEYIRRQKQRTAFAEAERRNREQQAEEAQLWQTFDRLRHQPSEDNARAAKRAFLALAKRHHPDQGGSHQAFLRLKDAYDRAHAHWMRVA
jgi:hypothetical protein